MWSWLRRWWQSGYTPEQLQSAALLKRANELDQVIFRADKTLEDARLELRRYQRELSLMTGRKYEDV